MHPLFKTINYSKLEITPEILQSLVFCLRHGSFCMIRICQPVGNDRWEVGSRKSEDTNVENPSSRKLRFSSDTTRNLAFLSNKPWEIARFTEFSAEPRTPYRCAIG